MITYEEVYNALDTTRKRYDDLSSKTDIPRQKQRCLRISSISEIFMGQIVDRQGEVESGIVKIGLSREELTDKLSEKTKVEVSTETLFHDLRGLAIDTNVGYQLKDYKINPYRTAKRRSMG